MQKGFTLVELVAIILILSLIFLVSFPSLKNLTKTEDDKKYDNMVHDLCMAGKSYMYSFDDYSELLSIVNNEIELEINELILYGNVDKNLINPKTNLSVENDILKYTVLEDFTLSCEYIPKAEKQ